MMEKRGRRVRKPVLAVGILLLLVTSFLIVKVVINSIGSNGPLAYKNSEVYVLKEHENIEFLIDYTNDKKINKLVEQALTDVYEDNEQIFANKDKQVKVELSINEPRSIISYVIKDSEGNINDIYGVLNIDLKTNKVIDLDNAYFDDLKGLSMNVRESLAKDETLAGNKRVYTKTLPEASSFKYVTFDNDGVSFYFDKDTFMSDAFVKTTLLYEEVLPYLSDEVLTVVDKDYERIDVSNVRYIDPLKPMIAITFDDGPTTTTSVEVAKYFNDNNAKLTFFWLGSRIEENKSVVKNTYDLGHEIANHSYDHPNFNTISDEALIEQTDGVNNMIKAITNQDRVLIRAPYGAANETVRSKINSPLIMWSVDTLDWQSRNQAAVYEHMMANAYDGSIILLHDLYDTSINAAMQFLDANKDKYQFVTVSELHAYRGIEMENGKFYFDALGE